MLIELTLTGAAVIAADQASKAFILSRPAAANPQPRFFSIRKVLTRRGAAASALVIYALSGLWVASAGICALMLEQGMIPANAMSAAGIGSALGGAAGNLADRLRHGAIVDFIAIGRWPVFNLADAAIVAGIGLLLWSFVQT
jgi:signal peptidase II